MVSGRTDSHHLGVEILTKRTNEEALWDDGFDLGSSCTVYINLGIHSTVHLRFVYFIIKLYCNKRVRQIKSPEKGKVTLQMCGKTKPWTQPS